MTLEYDRLEAKVSCGKAALWCGLQTLVLGRLTALAIASPGFCALDALALLKAGGLGVATLATVVFGVFIAVGPFLMTTRLELDEEETRSFILPAPFPLWLLLAYARRRGWDPTELDRPQW